MKYVILVGDGMGDLPVPELGGRTPLEAARTPNMDRLASRGRIGLARTIPHGLPPGSDVANLSLMGYDPGRYHTGRAPIEAASMGVELGPLDVAFRCNLVTLDRDEDRIIMVDYSSGHVTTEEAAGLIEALEQNLGDGKRKFHAGVSYRHLLVWPGGPIGALSLPPHDFTGRPVTDFFTKDGDTAKVADLTRRSWPVLEGHPVNEWRRQRGEPEANSIWLWGQGKRPSIPTLGEKFGVSGSVISAVDLVKGLGVLAGLEVIDVVGATGWLDTNYGGKVEAALESLRESDFVFVHIEAPDEAGHSGQADLKVRAIEDFDALVVGPMLAGLGDLGRHRVLLTCDHPTPLSIRTHSPDPVPFVLYDSGAEEGGGAGAAGYTEALASASGFMLEKGYFLIDLLLKQG